MKIGILSDSHGHVEPVRLALQRLDDAGAEAFIHCGDVGDIEVLEEFVGRKCWFVWGNTDYPPAFWRAEVLTLGLDWPDGSVAVQLAGKDIAVFHGHEPTFREALGAASHDYLFHGHTHERDDYHIGRMRVINPGALHRVARKTVAVLDLGTDQLTYLDVMI